MNISKKRLDELKKIQNSDIDYSNIPELDKDFWDNAKLVLPEKKISVSIRLDNDLLYWFKQQGHGYQTKINSVLKSYMQAHKR